MKDNQTIYDEHHKSNYQSGVKIQLSNGSNKPNVKASKWRCKPDPDELDLFQKELSQKTFSELKKKLDWAKKIVSSPNAEYLENKLIYKAMLVLQEYHNRLRIPMNPTMKASIEMYSKMLLKTNPKNYSGITDVLQNDVDNFFESKELKNLSMNNESTPHVCLINLSKKISIQCITCDPTQKSFFCFNCFSNGVHNEHDFEIHSNVNTICSCGNKEKFTINCFCLKHQKTEKWSKKNDKLIESVIRVVMPLYYFSINYPLESKLYDFIIRCRKILEMFFVRLNSEFQNNFELKIAIVEAFTNRKMVNQIIPKRILHNLRSKILSNCSPMKKQLNSFLTQFFYDGKITDNLKIREIINISLDEYAELWERFSILDLVFLSLTDSEQDIWGKLYREVFLLIQEACNYHFLKNRLVDHFMKLHLWCPNKIKNLLYPLLSIKTTKSLLNNSSIRVNMILTFFELSKLGVYNISNNKIIYIGLIWRQIFDFVEYMKFFKDEASVFLFFDSFNWKLLLCFFVIFEVMCNSNINLVYLYISHEKKNFYDDIQSILGRVVLYTFKAIIFLSKNSRFLLLQKLEKDVFLAFSEIENICKFWKNKHFPSQELGPFRVNLLRGFFSVILFTNYFVIFKKDDLPSLIQNSLLKDQKDSFRIIIGNTKEKRRKFYKNSVNNFIFQMSMMSNIFPLFTQMSKLEERFKFIKFTLLFWKCIIELDEIAKEIFIKEIKNFIQNGLLKQNQKNSYKILVIILKNIEGCLLSEITFEDFLISLRLMHQGIKEWFLDPSSKLFLETPGLVNRIVSFPREQINMMTETMQLHIFSLPFAHVDLGGKKCFQKYFDSIFQFDSDSNTFFIPHYYLQNQKKYFCNLYFSSILYKSFNENNEEIAARISHILDMYTWSNLRCKQNAEFLFNSGFFEVLFKIRNTFDLEKDNTIIINRGELIKIDIKNYFNFMIYLVLYALLKHKKINLKWFDELDKNKDKISCLQKELLKKIRNEAVKEELICQNNNNSQVLDINLKEMPCSENEIEKNNFGSKENIKSKALSKKSIKERKNKIIENDKKNKKSEYLKKIPFDLPSKNKINEKKESIKNNYQEKYEEPKCCVCKKKFQFSLQKFILVKFHIFKIEKIFKEQYQESHSPRNIFSTCGHYFHLECLPTSSTKSIKIKCSICSEEADTFLGTFSNEKNIQYSDLRDIRNFMFNNLSIAYINQQKKPNSMYDTFLAPIINSFKMIKTISKEAFQKRILPCASRILWFVYQLYDFNPIVFNIFEGQCKNILKPNQFWNQNNESLKSNTKILEKNVECLFIEVVFANTVCALRKYFSNKLQNKTNQSNYDTNLNNYIIENIFDLLPYFILLKCANISFIEFKDISPELIKTECFDLLWLGYLLIRFFKIDPSNEIMIHQFCFSITFDEKEIINFIESSNLMAKLQQNKLLLGTLLEIFSEKSIQKWTSGTLIHLPLSHHRFKMKQLIYQNFLKVHKEELNKDTIVFCLFCRKTFQVNCINILKNNSLKNHFKLNHFSIEMFLAFEKDITLFLKGQKYLIYDKKKKINSTLDNTNQLFEYVLNKNLLKKIVMSIQDYNV